MRQRSHRQRLRGKQRGWVGLLVILVAMVIVAWLAKDALKEYGLLGEMEKQPRAAADSVRGPGVGVTGVQSDTTTVTPAPLNALEKARGMQDTVREQAAEQSKRIDDALK